MNLGGSGGSAVNPLPGSTDAIEWLAAMCYHVPNKGEQMVRYGACPGGQAPRREGGL